MYLTHLSLTNFRAFARLDMDVPRGLLLLVGANAQGKTSLIESVYYLAAFTSFLAGSDRQLVNFLASEDQLAVGRILAGFTRGGTRHRLEVRLILEASGPEGRRLRKEILVDGVKRTAHESLGQFNAVIFLPQMTRIVEGSPEERRRYLNLALSQAVPGYSQSLSDYGQAITQRNALLKQLSERGGDPDQLVFWDETLTRRGAEIMHARIAVIQDLERLAARIHHRLTHSAEILRLDYQPAYDPAPRPEGQMALRFTTPVSRSGISLEQIRKGFAQRLVETRREDVARGLTSLGPHRDEMRFLANGIDLGDFGSRGQVRTALLALKLAEVQWLKEKTGEWPVLLLDETLAELDPQRRADLLEYLGEVEQGLLTTTDLGQFSPDFVKSGAVWKIHGGQVEN